MTREEAYIKLELEEGATSSEINQQYQEFYNEFQIRIANAPTEYQRTLYKKKLDALALAFETLGGQLVAPSAEELPGIAESIPEKPEPKAALPVSDKPQMTKEKALQVLGLGEKFTEKELNDAFETKASACVSGRDNAMNDVIRSAYSESLLECNAAHTLLKSFVFVPVIIPNSKIAPTQPAEVRTESKPSSKRKWLLPISIFGGIGIVLALVLMNTKETETKEEFIDPALSKEYVALKSQADLLAEMGNWEKALVKYAAAYVIVETSEVKDSIESMKNQLLLASGEKDGTIDERIEEANTDKKKELESRENPLKEAERLPQEKESKHIKIGDNYAGGIVFKVDASGKHGLVCASKDQGEFEWEEAKRVCNDLTLNGYSDWYLPSKNEFLLIRYNVYTVGGFAPEVYWNSTEIDDATAYVYNYRSHGQHGLWKNRTAFVRAIRAF